MCSQKQERKLPRSWPNEIRVPLDEALDSRGFKRLFSAERLKAYRESFQELKGNRQVCATTVAMTQNLLLAERRDMDHIIEAVRKIQAHSGALAKEAG